jgi:hypothetical protein
MLKIIEKDSMYRIVYYEIAYNRKKCVARLTDMYPYTNFGLHQLTALFIKHHAIRQSDGTFVFDNYQNAYNCYMDIAFDKTDNLPNIPLRFYEVIPIRDEKYVLAVSTIATPHHHINIKEVNAVCRLTITLLREIFLQYNATESVEENKKQRTTTSTFMFSNYDDAVKCGEHIEKMIMAKQVLKKLSK